MAAALKKPCYERVIALAMGVLFVYIMLIRTGTIWSGYHFLDDHELVRIKYSLEHGTSLWDQMRQLILNDLNTRYRPLYWVERTIGTALFGSNLYAWNLYKAAMAIVTLYLLYMTSYYLNQKWYINALFAAVIMVGTQITPWYRSANQENTGLFLCAVVLYLIARQHKGQKYQHVGYNVSIVTAAVLCSLEKESFVLMLPAFGALKYVLEYMAREVQDGEGGNRKTIRQACIKSNIVTYILMACAFLVQLYMLLFRVGLDKVSYAGFRKEISLREYLDGIWYSLTRNMLNYVWFGFILILLIVVCCQVIEKRYLGSNIALALIGCFIMVTQLVAHARSRMWERYIIPFIIGYAIVFVLVGHHMLEKDKLRGRVYAGVLAILVLTSMGKAKDMAYLYAQDGELINGYLNYILENTSEDSHIIGAYRDGEINGATSSWLEVHGRKKEYSYDWNTGGLQDIIHLGEINEETTDWENAEAVVCYSMDADLIEEMMGLTAGDSYLRQQYGQYAVIIRQ